MLERLVLPLSVDVCIMSSTQQMLAHADLPYVKLDLSAFVSLSAKAASYASDKTFAPGKEGWGW